jgi:spore germination protein GerM
VGRLITFLIVFLVAACAAPTASVPLPTPSPTAVPPTPSPTPAETMTVRAYFFLDDAAGGDPALVPVQRTVPKTQATARAAMMVLLAGPSDEERAARPRIGTVIPAGTELLGIEVSDGVATVDLSGTFESGGGTLSVLGRLAQVVYTLTQFSTVDRVRFELDGEPVTVFSSEGIILDEPGSRTTYQDEFLPAIFVDRPAWGAALLNPGRVTGLANVFEAQFRIALLDRDARVLVDRPVLATCGTGCWGHFDVTLEYDVPAAQWGTLRVWDPSERDGSPENVREYPVYLGPRP